MKLKTKISLGISVLVLVLVCAISFLYLASWLSDRMQQIATDSDRVAHEVYEELRPELELARDNQHLDAADPAQLQTFLASLSKSPFLGSTLDSAITYPANSPLRDVALLDSRGAVVADSNPLLVGQKLEPRSSFQQIVHASLWQQFAAIYGRERIFDSSLPLEFGDRPIGSIHVGIDTALVRSALSGRIRSLLIWGVLVVLISIFLSVAFSDFVLSPLTALSEQLDRFTGGEAHPAKNAGVEDEYGVVSSKIQRLGQQIQDARQIYSTLQENVTHVLESLEEGLLYFDTRARAVMASAAAQRFLGLEPMQVLRRSVEEIFPGDSSLDTAVRTAIQQGVSFPVRELERRPGGKPLLARLDLLGEPGRPLGALLTLRDAEHVRRLEDEIEVARRLSAIGRLTRGVAHEVKNPLNAMAIHLDLLREKARRGGSGVERHVDIIGREIERLDRVLKTFLDFTRPTEMQLRQSDLVEVAQTVRELAAAAALVEGVTIAVESGQPSLVAWVDRDLIEQALLNLVNNGVQAMAEFARRNGSAGRLTIAVAREHEDAVIRVIDEGPGVAPEIREKIFDLYFSTREGGSGIGLAVTARVMQLHNGAVDLEEGDRGATFVLRFPLRVRAAEVVS